MSRYTDSDYLEADEAQHYNPQLPHPLTTASPDRWGNDPSYHYSRPLSVPPPPPLLPPGATGSALANPFDPPSDASLPPQHAYQQFNYDSNDHNDPYQRPYSTHPSGTFSPPPAREYDYAAPLQMQPPQPHTSYFEPHYGSEPQLTPPSTGYTLQDDGVQPADEEERGDIPLLTRRRNYSESLGGRVPGAYEPSINDNASEVNIHYGRIPQRVPRRFKTTKKIQLYNGNLVLDCPVPSKFLDLCPQRTEREMTHMRYTAATCDPNDFRDEGYALRQVLYDPPRKTELFIVLTMYNEDEELFAGSMYGVMKNIAHLCTRQRSKTWGKDGWKKVVVCIVSDGRSKINARTLSTIAAMGIYQDGVAKNVVGGKPVVAHIYEYTTQISITPSLKIKGAEQGAVPVQVIFCLKEKNQKKINSHRWFFNAFGPVLEPNVCVLLDVGTQPGPTSIYHLWKAFDINSNVGGACGEIVALKGKYWQNLLNPLVAAQNFEYKMSNILDKPLESIFGYITVLPGAFSAYRYIALQNHSGGEGPLQKYFLGEKMHGADADIFTANMYLAEDRILCWELVSKRGGSWILHYVKSAYAVTDVPDRVPELISQRRRWLNGSFFAAIHSTVKFGYIYRSSHTFARKFCIHIEMLYQTFNLVFSWFALANFYIAFIILTGALEDPVFHLGRIDIPNAILQYLYLGLLVMCFLLSLGNRPQGSKWGYTVAMIGFAVITVYMTVAAIFLAIKGIQSVQAAHDSVTGSSLWSDAVFRNIVLSLLATFGLYLVSSVLFFEPWHMFTSFVQYLLLAPSYINVLNVYAFANVHDVSWGTKGDNAPVKTDLGVVAKAKDNNVEVAVPTEEKDINAAYEDAIAVISSKAPKVEQKRDSNTKKEDYYRQFRTKLALFIVLLAWTLSNGALAVTISHANSNAKTHGASASVNGYMAFILFSVVGLAFFRFVGATSYLIVRLFAGE